MEVMGNRGTVEEQQWERAPLVLPETFVKNVKSIESVNKQLQVETVTKVKTVGLNVTNSCAYQGERHISDISVVNIECRVDFNSSKPGDGDLEPEESEYDLGDSSFTLTKTISNVSSVESDFDDDISVTNSSTETYEFGNNLITIYYTNADGLLNKKDELELIIKEKKPSFIVITEVFPKNWIVYWYREKGTGNWRLWHDI